MDYQQLRSFLVDKMRMSHVYQPVMIRFLLSNNGVADDLAIAKEIAQYDPSQIDYYRVVTNKMVGKVLRSHKVVEKVDNAFVLRDFSQLKPNEVEDLIRTCNEKLQAYLEQRGRTIWNHRSKQRNPVPGSVRYKVLARANGRCELCGCPHTEKALEVDHIIPKNIGGDDSINNYQALCYICNANKGDRDSTDFRSINDKYEHREKECIFCTVDKDRIVGENNLGYVVYDKYPVTEYHALIIPKRHFADYFDILQPELNSLQGLLHIARQQIIKKDKTVKGFNIGINSGAAAGQTILHCHLHLIPRRAQDVENPAGGVRRIMPGKGYYAL
jgi:ATP adenylyltransferase